MEPIPIEARTPNLTYMPSIERAPQEVSHFLIRSSFGMSVAGLLFLTPPIINGFLEGRILTSAGGAWIVLLLTFNAWTCRRGVYNSWLVFLGILPAILFFLVLNILERKIIGVLWVYPAVLSLYCILPELRAWLANFVLLLVVLPVAWTILDIELFLRVVITLLTVSSFSAIFVNSSGYNQKKLNSLAETDPLTGLQNRMFLSKALDSVISRSVRANIPMSLIYIDIDHFKLVNDTFGHSAGDQVLIGFGELLQQRFRTVDGLFRIGGEEFLVLLFDTDLETAAVLAEELRVTTEQYQFIPKHNITVSIGVTQLLKDDDGQSWMRRADVNLYQAKESRNKVMAS